MILKSIFIITSAINHFKSDELSRFTVEDRFGQTLETIESIRGKSPLSKIFLCELSEKRIPTDYENILKSKVDLYHYFGDYEDISNMYLDFSNNDINLFKYAKSMFEIKGMVHSLNYLKDNDELVGIKRIFKITGRYMLNNNFEIDDYKTKFLKNKYVCQFRHFTKNETPDNVHYHVFKNEGILTTAFWSMDINLLDETIVCLEKSYDYLFRMMLYTPGNDIEHAMYEYIDKNKLIYSDVLGVTLRKGMDENDCKI